MSRSVKPLAAIALALVVLSGSTSVSALPVTDSDAAAASAISCSEAKKRLARAKANDASPARIRKLRNARNKACAKPVTRPVATPAPTPAPTPTPNPTGYNSVMDATPTKVGQCWSDYHQATRRDYSDPNAPRRGYQPRCRNGGSGADPVAWTL